MKEPTRGNGKICYVEIPALSIEKSSSFYHTVFGWRLRTDNYGSVSFDDAVGEVSGMWVLDRKPMIKPGLIVSIMVDDAFSILESIKENGGKVIFSNTMSSGEHIAHFTDPAGNVMGIYQESPQN